MKKSTALLLVPSVFMLFSCGKKKASNKPAEPDIHVIDDEDVEDLKQHAVSISADPNAPFYLKIGETRDLKVTLSPPPTYSSEKELIENLCEGLNSGDDASLALFLDGIPEDTIKQLQMMQMALYKNIDRISNKAGKEAMLGELEHLHDIPTTLNEYDTQGMLLNTDSGIVNLENGEILTSFKEYRIILLEQLNEINKAFLITNENIKWIIEIIRKLWIIIEDF